MAHVLIVDDEPAICYGIRELLTEEGYDVCVVPSAEEALAAVDRRPPDAVFLDVRLPGMDGLSALGPLRQRIGDAPVIMMTAFGDLRTAVGSLEQGAFEYLPKPFNLEDVSRLVRQALDRGRPADAIQPAADANDPLLLGRSHAMQQVFKQIALAAHSQVPVLITGESGTGKELVAQAIHRHGLRKTGPFVPVCLPALSPQLIESELFGHVKGAFTGAEAARTGFLELATGGTVFLDEIGDVAPPLQVKLLRAIEQQEVTPVGGGQARRTDFRVVAATNRPLDALRATGEFRADLYYRLSVFRIALPPLRERQGDVPLLARHFLRRADRPGQERRLSDAALAELVRRRWVGNVRELRNVVERAAIATRGDEIHVEHLPPAEAPLSDCDPLASSIQRDISDWARTELHNPPGGESEGLYERFLSLAEPPLFAAALEHAGGNRAAAARELGIHRATLRERLKRNGASADREADST
jgi:two-component system nitrogen regulation response regulator GlnG